MVAGNTTGLEVREAAMDLLDILERAVILRDLAIAQAEVFRHRAENAYTPKLMHALSSEATGIENDIKTDEITLEQQRVQVLDFLDLLNVAEVERPADV